MNSQTGHFSFRDPVAVHPCGQHGNIRLLVEIALALWFALVLFLGAVGAFVQPPNLPPLPIFVGVFAPLAVFLAAYRLSDSFRAFVLASDLRLAAAIQGWRVAGLGFLALYTYGILPGQFAIPAGVGDIAIGVTAPWIASALIRRPAFLTTRIFTVWNLLGILDLVVAVATGTLSSGFFGKFTPEITSAPMARLPLILIPAYLVPLFVMLHLAALFQARAATRSNHANAFLYKQEE